MARTSMYGKPQVSLKGSKKLVTIKICLNAISRNKQLVRKRILAADYTRIVFSQDFVIKLNPSQYNALLVLRYLKEPLKP